MFVARHLQTLIDAGDDPATADLDPDADAVAVLTVHKAKGLEFPVVYLPGLVAGRFPGNGRGEPLALPADLGRGLPPTPERALAEERRLCYVAMTRARDELILSHAADYGGCPRPQGLAVRARGARPAAQPPRPGTGVVAASAESSGLAAFAAVDLPVEAAPRADRRAPVAELRPDRRLPDLPAPLQVRACAPRAGRAPSRDDLRLRAPQGRPAVPPSPCQGPRHDGGRARRRPRRVMVERGVRIARPRGGRAWRPRARPCAGSARSSSSPAR